MAMDYRNIISELVDEKKQVYAEMSDAIWGFAEPRFQEFESSKIQQEYLASRGFAIKADLAGEETAFIAEYGSGKPILAFLGEFDALSSLQQEADQTERILIEGKTNGHGCHHHLLGTSAVAAVDALKAYMEENQLSIFKGKVKLLMSGIQDKNVAILGGAALIWKQHLEAVIENY